MKRTIFKLVLACTGCLILWGCSKVENTTPRFINDACVVCNRFGHADDAGKCFYCKGDGVCSFCNGKGKRLLGKKDNFYEAECAFCKGGGKCHYCKGAGKCNICGGSGKYAPLKPKTDKAPQEIQKESANESSE